jgi:hypothetical protein
MIFALWLFLTPPSYSEIHRNMGTIIKNYRVSGYVDLDEIERLLDNSDYAGVKTYIRQCEIEYERSN